MARAAFTVAWLVLLLSGGWRWHTGAVMAPLRVNPAGGPAIVLVTQGRDCPDRLAAMDRWIESVLARTLRGGAPEIRIARLGGLVRGGEAAEGLELLDPRDARVAGRAFSRFATDGTPGALVLDESGHAVAGFGFTPTGPDRAWDALAGMAHSLGLAPVPSDPSLSPFIPEDGSWNR
ncbi:MAG: hypothetical protein WD960_11250 [Gemmatimonadota bacterium]